MNFNFSKQIVMDQLFNFICYDNVLKREKHRETCENYVCHIVSFELHESVFKVLSTLFTSTKNASYNSPKLLSHLDPNCRLLSCCVIDQFQQLLSTVVQ